MQKDGYTKHKVKAHYSNGSIDLPIVRETILGKQIGRDYLQGVQKDIKKGLSQRLFDKEQRKIKRLFKGIYARAA